MAEAYDPEVERTWTGEQRELSQAVWYGLIDGDLKPLVEYLRSPYPVTRSLRNNLIACIEGDNTLHTIVCKKQRDGAFSVREAVAVEQRMHAIVKYVDARTPEVRGKVSCAIQDACIHFGVSKSTVMKARAKFKAIREGKADGLSFSMRTWTKS